ncbi:17-beta dehydrogenase 4 variant [Phlyctochytrium arcticum]|nr:17-beta dehydrogenase 4 variant [Phlyctochytrium arcticum]
MADNAAAEPFTYSERDLILYALGVGCAVSPDNQDLRWIYENHEDFAALPTFAVVPPFALMASFPFGDHIPDFNPMMLLHGEQFLEIKAPLPTSGTVSTTAKIVSILDKGKGCVVALGTETRDEQGNLLCYNEFSNFIRGVKGVGTKTTPDRGPATATNEPPSRQPDRVFTEKTDVSQAALYRLSGDTNPLHIDPNMSSIGGFDVPILHGLCTFGIATKHVLKEYAGADPTKLRNVKVRFSKHVFPGETLQTEMWKEGNKVIFQVRVVERDVLAISNAAVELVGDETTSANSPTEVDPNSLVVPNFKAGAIFDALRTAIESGSDRDRASRVKRVNAIFQFNISNASNETQTWFVDLKTQPGSVGSGTPTAKPLATISISDDDFVNLAAGKANAQKLFMSGRIKIKGQMNLAMKLDGVLAEARNKAKL